MPTAADAASLEPEMDPIQDTSGRVPTFKRVYQACESCRQKKQKCSLGDPANPKRPCNACRRANLLCVLPERKRKGRPPKKSEHDVSNGEPRADTNTISDFDFNMRYPANKEGQSPWQRFTGSFSPIVGNNEGVTTSAPSSGESHRNSQLPSYDQQMASQTLATFPLRNTSDAIRLLDQDRAPSGAEQSAGADILGAGPSRPQFFLLREGLVDEATLFRLFRFYLASLHPIMPLIPSERRPTTSEHILIMAGREPHFMAAILVVTTGLLGEHTLHHHLWQRVERLFAEVAIKGTNGSLEMIEGLLLLSEYPPNMGHSTGLGFEDRMCWMTVGTAVRLGYLLGLEQLVMQPDDMEDKFVDDPGRGKIVWSCPGMTIQHLHFDPADDFPQMREIEGLQDDHAAYLQCLMHITQVLSNAHDLLYPSKSHSLAIAKAEHYYKHIDEFTEGLMGSVDARFIIEAMNAGGLAYLPLRFFLFFTHAGVFLLKAAVIVPLPPSQKRALLHLIRGLIKCMSMASSDHRHPAVRNSSALDGLLRRIYRDHEMQTPAATRPPSPRMGSSGAVVNSTEPAAAWKPHSSGADLPTFLGSIESPFVAERPLQELAADIDAVFGLEPGNPSVTVPLAPENTYNDLSTIPPASDIFASLFNYDDREFWGAFTPMTLE
ncbi:hypothetical protein H2200_005402 [Cladophialophora chaetospira]|uniref:Zn(2)-C6 fungal-type domain-containing protein n=1 Tax=Cladophialophora chaetospira TaxID=386627 RepID=A0AA38XBX9_9EURO|nr:hypothetical protein H2200_005402 [Cladophialophora chaetospira]